jgi:hypothetical protein
MTPDIFNSDLFTMTSLTASINKVPYVPTRIGELGWFQEAGVGTLDVWIEEQNGVVSILDVKPRGAPGAPVSIERRKGRSFRIPHIPAEGAVYADEVAFIREFGSESSVRTLESVIGQKQAIARQSIDYTIEVHRIKAVQGSFIDANNDEISLFTTFGVTQQTQAMGWHKTNSSNFREKCLEVKKKIRAGLGGIPYRGVRVLCSDEHWAALIEDKDFKATYLNQAQAAELRGDPTNVVSAGGFIWEWYEGTSACKIAANKAYAVPDGVPGLFLTRYAPVDAMQGVGQLGLPYYSIPKMLDYDAGVAFKASSNPLNICTRPASIIELSIS